ncbi:MAG: BatA domain-containing protein [Akkermansiaceae bacterium]
MTLANPLGLLALIAIPIVIAIHFLQRRAQVIPSSTLFLLEKTQKESASGRKFDRLMNSIPLWLQLLIVLLITWLLVQPRFLKSNSTQRIAIVLDSSASMSVFTTETKAKLKEILPNLQNSAEQAEYWLHESNTSKSRLYHGHSLEDLLTAIDNWKPLDGASDPTHALRISRSLTGAEGALLFLTDTPKKSIPYNAHIHSIGSYKPNCGFTGVSFETQGTQHIWQTLVRNYSNEPQTRTWYLENQKGQRTPEKSITIEPRKIISLRGAIPAGSTTAKLVLSPDSFTLDDSLPLIIPQPKTLLIHASAYKPYEKLTSSITTGFANTRTVTTPEEADAQLITQTALTTLTNNAICFNNAPTKNAPYLKGNIVAEKHPLMDGLNWQSLLLRQVPSIPHTAEDQVLLWQGTRALVFLRPVPGNKQSLIFNFDITLSNIDKSESAVVLLYRFLNNIREAKPTHQQAITETSQPLDIITPPKIITPENPLTLQIQPLTGTETITRTYRTNTKLHAPASPCYFYIKQGDTKILSAANHFADTREADFSECDTAYLPASTNASAVFKHTTGDPYWRYWVLLILAALALAWHHANKQAKPLTAN